MPSKYSHPREENPRLIWRARVKKDYVEYYLGRFETESEARQVEDIFRKAMGWSAMPTKSKRHAV